MMLAVWMGDARGGHFIRDWALVVLLLAALTVVASAAGVYPGTRSPWRIIALGRFAGYAAWTLASLLWSPNRGDAWIGAGQSLLYRLAFGLAVALIASGASHRWVLAASVLGPAVVAAFTLPALVANRTACRWSALGAWPRRGYPVLRVSSHLSRNRPGETLRATQLGGQGAGRRDGCGCRLLVRPLQRRVVLADYGCYAFGFIRDRPKSEAG